MEGEQGLAYDLTKQPTYAQVMEFYARRQFLPAAYMTIFEQKFHIGLSSLTINLAVRYIAFKDAQKSNPVHQRILAEEEKEHKREQEKATKITPTKTKLKNERQCPRTDIRLSGGGEKNVISTYYPMSRTQYVAQGLDIDTTNVKC